MSFSPPPSPNPPNSTPSNSDIIHIHQAGDYYLIYSPTTISTLRSQYHICGTLIGTLFQISQQNVFLGLPLQLMPEEVSFLVRRGLAIVVRDLEGHRNALARVSDFEKQVFKDERNAEECERGESVRVMALEKKDAALKKRGLAHVPSDPLQSSPLVDVEDSGTQDGSEGLEFPQVSPNPSKYINDTNRSSRVSGSSLSSSLLHSKTAARQSDGYKRTIIDITSPSLTFRPNLSLANTRLAAEEAIASRYSCDARYQLYAFLHGRGYYMTPGLRFGAQVVAYPGDPLRFHSHFVASGVDWEQDIPVMDIVGGGRLGTGVKKAWLIGAQDSVENEYRCFTIEWAGF